MPDGSRLRCRLAQKLDLVLNEKGGGQGAIVHINARIDGNPVGAVLCFLHNRMAVNNLLGKGAFEIQEAVPDPSKIAILLLSKGDFRPQSGVHNHIIAKLDEGFEAFNKLDVGFRNPVLELIEDLFRFNRQKAQIVHAVGPRCISSAPVEPADHPSDIASEDIEKDLLVISHQEGQMNVRMGEATQKFDNLRRLRAPIDQIADKDNMSFMGRVKGRNTLTNPFKEALKWVEAPMNVADDVSAFSLRREGRRNGRGIFFAKKFLEHFRSPGPPLM